MKAAEVNLIRRLLAAKAAKGRRHLVRTGQAEIGKERTVIDVATGLETKQRMTSNDFTRAVIGGVLALGQDDVLRLMRRTGITAGRIVGRDGEAVVA